MDSELSNGAACPLLSAIAGCSAEMGSGRVQYPREHSANRRQRTEFAEQEPTPNARCPFYVDDMIAPETSPSRYVAPKSALPPRPPGGGNIGHKVTIRANCDRPSLSPRAQPVCWRGPPKGPESLVGVHRLGSISVGAPPESIVSRMYTSCSRAIWRLTISSPQRPESAAASRFPPATVDSAKRARKKPAWRCPRLIGRSWHDVIRR
jgi:hypothetical protein